MSEFRVEVVRVGAIEAHPDADSLGITKVHGGYPVIVKLGQFQEGDLAVYVPVDAIVPGDDPRWAFLGDATRIKAKRLRGIFSMGLLAVAEPEWREGEDVQEALRITRWEPPPPPGWSHGNTEDLPDPGLLPVYTDIEALRRWPTLLVAGEEVIVTEKLHGENTRAVFVDGQLWVSSRTRFKRRGGGWWKAAETAGLEQRLAQAPGIGLYGEAHGYTGGFPYGATRGGALFRAFDAFDLALRRYLDFDDFARTMAELGIESAPVLHRGPWDPTLLSLAEGPSTLDPSHVREGIVVRPARERWDANVGRVILKLHGEGFLLGKKGR